MKVDKKKYTYMWSMRVQNQDFKNLYITIEPNKNIHTQFIENDIAFELLLRSDYTYNEKRQRLTMRESNKHNIKTTAFFYSGAFIDKISITESAWNTTNEIIFVSQQ